MKKNMDKMVLEPGTYEIPDDCTAAYKNRELIIKKKKRIILEDVKHCKDCIHQQIGRKLFKNQYWDSAFCDIRPKPNTDGRFYCAPNSRIACYKFDPKNTTDNESK